MSVGRVVLLTIVPESAKLVDQWLEPLNMAMDRYEINTPLRQAAFLAQVAHESGAFKYVKELWGPTEAQKRYEGRADLGNTQPGDGSRFRGRGLIQITGRTNYEAYGKYRGILSVAHPELLELPEYAADSAGWFWTVYKKLNPLADAGSFKEITKRINGGYNGWTERVKYYDRARAVL